MPAITSAVGTGHMLRYTNFQRNRYEAHSGLPHVFVDRTVVMINIKCINFTSISECNFTFITFKNSFNIFNDLLLIYYFISIFLFIGQKYYIIL